MRSSKASGGIGVAKLTDVGISKLRVTLAFVAIAYVCDLRRTDGELPRILRYPDPDENGNFAS